MTVVLTDIEGTTSSISFVKDVLFPYAAEQLPVFIKQHADDSAVRPLLDQIKAGYALTTDAEVCSQCLQWIAEDKKQTQLKALQGLIWQAGYESGAYQAHVYPDARDVLQQWHECGIDLYIYSSGSIHAQKLFFGYSCFGDMTALFKGYFDTTSGPKQEADSYRRIAESIGSDAADIIFLSDVVAELDAAAAAGMQTVHVQRSPAMDSGAHAAVQTFHEIELQQGV